MAEFYRAVRTGLVDAQCAGTVLLLVQNNVTRMRGAAADVLMYRNEPVPPVYVHLLRALSGPRAVAARPRPWCWRQRASWRCKSSASFSAWTVA